MSKFYVERQVWQRWPRVLLMCKDTGNGIERRRYVPEGGTVEEWKARLRDVLQLERSAREDHEQAMASLQAEHRRSESPQAEVDGLKTMVEDRDGLIRDMHAQLLDAHDPREADGFEERMRDMGIDSYEGTKRKERP